MVRRFISLIVVLLLFPLAPFEVCAKSSSSSVSIRTATGYYEIDDYKKTLKECDLILDENAHDNEALRLKGKCYLALGELDNATQDLEKAEKLDGPLEEAMANQSTLDQNDKDNLAYPRWIESLVLLYVAHLNADDGRLDRANRICKLALSRYPIFPECMLLRATILLEQNLLYESEEQFRQCIMLRPKDWHFWLGYSKILEKQVKYTQSLGALERAMVLIKTPPYEEPDLDKRLEQMAKTRENLKHKT